MADQTPQNYGNHTRFDPPFHFFLIPIFLATFIWTIVYAFQHGGLRSWLHVVLAFAALLAVFHMRFYSLKVQDRVIRLEERIRLSAILTDPLRSRINELTTKQLVALRFASDGEVAGLVEKALAGAEPKAIKQAIVNWRADNERV
jgi:hypothetical protein